LGKSLLFARPRRQHLVSGDHEWSNRKSLRVPLSFLGRGEYQAMLVRDLPDEPAAVRIEETKMREGVAGD
jgi:hypothetical protein